MGGNQEERILGVGACTATSQDIPHLLTKLHQESTEAQQTRTESHHWRSNRTLPRVLPPKEHGQGTGRHMPILHGRNWDCGAHPLCLPSNLTEKATRHLRMVSRAKRSVRASTGQNSQVPKGRATWLGLTSQGIRNRPIGQSDARASWALSPYA